MKWSLVRKPGARVYIARRRRSGHFVLIERRAGRDRALGLVVQLRGGTAERLSDCISSAFRPWPDGLLHHAVLRTPDGLLVVETWEAPADLRRFLAVARPDRLLAAAGFMVATAHVHRAARVLHRS